MTRGRAKVMVLPDPVKAMPTMSLPARATGRPCIWMGVGRRMFFAASASRMGAGNFMSRKDWMGGGMSSPSTRMCHLSLTASHAPSPWASSFRGHLQLVRKESLYSTPCASSDAACRALVWTWEASLRMRSSSPFLSKAFLSASDRRSLFSLRASACSRSEVTAPPPSFSPSLPAPPSPPSPAASSFLAGRSSTVPSSSRRSLWS